jgi:hypothetical protein
MDDIAWLSASPPPTADAHGRTTSVLIFEVTSYQTLLELVDEFAFHRGVTTATSFDLDTFVLAVECARSESIVWDVSTTVGLFDPEARLVYPSR